MKEDKELENYIDKIGIEDKKLISKLLISKFIPSMKQLFRVMRKKGYFIDSQDTSLKALIRKSYKLREEGFNENERFVYLGLIEPINKINKRLYELENKEVKKGSLVFCNHKDYGVGEVISINSHNLMLVKFQNKVLNIMCNSETMTTVHDDIKRKITKL